MNKSSLIYKFAFSLSNDEPSEVSYCEFTAKLLLNPIIYFIMLWVVLIICASVLIAILSPLYAIGDIIYLGFVSPEIFVLEKHHYMPFIMWLGFGLISLFENKSRKAKKRRTTNSKKSFCKTIQFKK
jgi:hypothetical protein